MSQDIEGRSVKHAKRHGKDAKAAGKQKKARPVLETAPRPATPAVADNGQCKFARVLGSPDYQTREQGLQALTRWLTQKSNITELDMLKIWKGLFFCFWHSDKVPVQTDLAERLAAILPRMHKDMGLLYMRTFIATLRREWFTIDRLRLDKFMLLVRKFIGQMLSTVAASKWNTALAKEYAALLEDQLLLPPDAQRAASLSYHVSDLYINALRATADATTPPSCDALLALLQPFAAALQRGGEPVLLARVREGVFAELAREAASPSEGAPLAALPVMELSELLFDMGAKDSIKARNREALYGASQVLQRAAGKRRKLGGSEAGALAVDVEQRQQQPANGFMPAVQQIAGGAKAAGDDGKGKRKKQKQQASAAQAHAAGEPPAAAAEQGNVLAEVAVTSKVQKKRKQHAPDADALATVGATSSAPTENGHTAAQEQSGSKKRKSKAHAAAVAAVAEALAVRSAGDAAGALHAQEPEAAAAQPRSSSKKQRAAAAAAAASTAAHPVQQDALLLAASSAQHPVAAPDGVPSTQQQQHNGATPDTSSKKKRKSLANGISPSGSAAAAGSPHASTAGAAEGRDVVTTGSDQQAVPGSHKQATDKLRSSTGGAGSLPGPGTAGAASDAAAKAGTATPARHKQQHSNTPRPSTGKRSRKQQQAEAATPAHGTPSTPASLKATGIPLTTPQAAATPSTGTATPRQQQQQQQQAALANGGDSPLHPGARTAPAKGTKVNAQKVPIARGAATAVKKGVRFDEQQNLVFKVGGPVPLPDIRTPPPAKPKGSALKQQQPLQRQHGRAGGARKAPASAPPKPTSAGVSLGNVNGQGRQQQQPMRRLVTPKSAPRPRAASFF